jgi:hypothetical protein
MDHEPDQQKVAGCPGDEQHEKMVSKNHAKHAGSEKQDAEMTGKLISVTSEITPRICRHIGDDEKDQSCHDPTEAIGSKQA